MRTTLRARTTCATESLAARVADTHHGSVQQRNTAVELAVRLYELKQPWEDTEEEKEHD